MVAKQFAEHQHLLELLRFRWLYASEIGIMLAENVHNGRSCCPIWTLFNDESTRQVSRRTTQETHLVLLSIAAGESGTLEDLGHQNRRSAKRLNRSLFPPNVTWRPETNRLAGRSVIGTFCQCQLAQRSKSFGRTAGCRKSDGWLQERKSSGDPDWQLQPRSKTSGSNTQLQRHNLRKNRLSQSGPRGVLIGAVVL